MIVAMKCLNEEYTVKRCLGNFHDEPFCEKIIVIDGKSTDMTLYELKQFPKVKVFVHEWHDWYHANEVCQSNIVLSYIPNGELMMIMDFDEIMSPELIAYLNEVHESGGHEIRDLHAIHFSRRTFELIRYPNTPHAMIEDNGLPLKSHQIGQYPDYQCRMFRRDFRLHWVNSPHHVLCGHKTEEYINADIIHFEKDDYRDRERIEKKWARCQARRKELGLSADIFETEVKTEIAEFYSEETWK